jgi:hypothetical protein
MRSIKILLPSVQSLLVCDAVYEGVSISFRTGHLERELQMIELSATKCSCVAILWVGLVGFAAVTLCVFIVDVYFFIDSVRKFLDIPSYCSGRTQMFGRTLPFPRSYRKTTRCHNSDDLDLNLHLHAKHLVYMNELLTTESLRCKNLICSGGYATTYIYIKPTDVLWRQWGVWSYAWFWVFWGLWKLIEWKSKYFTCTDSWDNYEAFLSKSLSAMEYETDNNLLF